MRRIVVIALAAAALSGCGVSSNGDWDAKGCSTAGNVTVCRMTVRGKRCEASRRIIQMDYDLTRNNCELPR